MASATAAQTNNDQLPRAIGHLNHVWMTLLAEDRMRQEAGLRFASHMWDQRPYWYLWLRNSPGVYRLDLLGAQVVAGYDWLAEFVIKYYPSEAESSFAGLSLLEKHCRRSDIFSTAPSTGGGCPCHGHAGHHGEERFADLRGGTGAPGIRHVALIPSDFFYAGNLLLAHREGAGSLWRLKSQSKWRIVMTKDHDFLDTEGNLLGTLRKGEVDRNFPGLAVSEFLYRTLVRNWKIFHGYPRCVEQAWTGCGVHFESDGKDLRPAVAPDIERIVAQAELFIGAQQGLPPLPDSDIEQIIQEKT